MKTFKEAWEDKKKEGYQYGQDALEGVEFGWDIALKVVVARLRELDAPGWDETRKAIADAIERGDL